MSTAAITPTETSRDRAVRRVALLKERLGGPDGKSVPWRELSKVLRVWDRVSADQHRLVKHARRLLGALDVDYETEDGQDETRENLRVIVAGGVEERRRHFTLALCWRRFAIWHHLRRNPADIVGALDLFRLYLDTTAPASEGSAILGTTDEDERKLLAGIAGRCEERLDLLRSWLERHPDAHAILKDLKGKGKGRSHAGSSEDARSAKEEVKHFRMLVEEIEPLDRLKGLIEHTADWLQALEARLEYVQSFTDTRSMTIDRQRTTRQVTLDRIIRPAQQDPQVLPSNAAEAAEAVEKMLDEMTSPNKSTIDRGTSPDPEVQGSRHLNQTTTAAVQAHSTSQENIQDSMNTEPSTNITSATSTNAVAQNLLGVPVDSPPSPDSLPSPHAAPAPTQNRKRPAPTFHSPRSSPDETAAPPDSNRSLDLPPLESSNSDGYLFERHNEPKKSLIEPEERTSSPFNASQPSLPPDSPQAKRPRVLQTSVESDRLSLPMPLAVRNILQEKAAEKERERQILRESAQPGEYTYNPWDQLVGYKAPSALKPHTDTLAVPSVSHETESRESSVPANLDDLRRGLQSYASLAEEHGDSSINGNDEELHISQFLSSEQEMEDAMLS